MPDININYPKISLKAARVNANLSQKEAAERLGITPGTLRSYEEGETVPNWETVKSIEEIYRFPMDYIFFARKLA